MRMLPAIRSSGFTVVLLVAATLLAAVWPTDARASVASETATALGSHAQGDYGLEVAILAILDHGVADKPPHVVAEEILAASSTANDAQMAAIGRALARKARALAESRPAESRAIAAAVLRAGHPALRESFKRTSVRRVPGLEVPTGSGGGGLDTPSPN